MLTNFKERQEMISKGIIPKDYDKSSGIIKPSDWKIDKLYNCLEFKNGLNYLSGDIGNVIEIIGVGDFKDRFYAKLDNLSKIEISTFNKEFLLENEDILFVRSNGNKELIGRVLFLNNVKKDISYSGFVIRGRVIKENMLPEYCARFCSSNIVKKQYLIKGGGTNISNLSQKILGDIDILIPPKHEQKKIVYILRNSDEIINTQRKLIESKLKYKKSLMNVLLSGKKKLEGKCYGFTELRLRDFNKMYSGGTPSTAIEPYWDGNISWIQSGLIQNNVLQTSDITKYITELGLKKSSAKLISKNSVLIAITGATCANIAYLTFEATANQSVISLTPNEKIDSKYLYYLMQFNRNRILSIQGGSAQGGVTLNDLKNFKVRFPDDVKIQNKISNLLTSIDNEIDLLKKELGLYEVQKKILLKALLSGTLRVK